MCSVQNIGLYLVRVGSVFKYIMFLDQIVLANRTFCTQLFLTVAFITKPNTRPIVSSLRYTVLFCFINLLLSFIKRALCTSNVTVRRTASTHRENVIIILTISWLLFSCNSNCLGFRYYYGFSPLHFVTLFHL